MRYQMLLAGVFAAALGFGTATPRASAAEETIDTYGARGAATQVDPQQVIWAKAMVRAKERANRMALRDYYGIRPARPQRVATPLVGVGFTGRTYGVVAPLQRGYLFR